MRRDDLSQHPLVSQAIRPQRIAIAQAKRMDHRQIAWMSRLKVPPLQCRGKNRFRRYHPGPIAADSDRVAVMDQTGGASGVQKVPHAPDLASPVAVNRLAFFPECPQSFRAILGGERLGGGAGMVSTMVRVHAGKYAFR